MDAKKAVVLAKQHIAYLFADEQLINIGLEEVMFDDETNEWIITIGFSRPWDQPRQLIMVSAVSTFSLLRTYKVVRIASDSDRLRSIQKRELQS